MRLGVMHKHIWMHSRMGSAVSIRGIIIIVYRSLVLEYPSSGLTTLFLDILSWKLYSFWMFGPQIALGLWFLETNLGILDSVTEVGA